MPRFAFALLLLSLAGCYASDVPEPCHLAVTGRRLDDLRAEAVDLLFVMDNSRSMAPYQAALRREFPRLVRGIVTGDHDGDPSTPSFPPVSSVRVGFVTTDMGQAGLGTFPDDVVRAKCGTGHFEDYGDDGMLIREPVGQNTPDNPTGLDCDFDGDGVPDVISPSALPDFLTFDAPIDELPPAQVDGFVRRASCYGLPGIAGCGSEMPLESALKALTPSTSPIRFYTNPGEAHDRGRGDDPFSNAGWLRDDAVLAIVVLSDEDDCSTHDRRVFDWGAGGAFADPDNPSPGDPTSPYARAFQRAANTRCVRFESALLDVERFVDGLLALRSEPRRVVFTSIVGVPPDLVDEIELGEGIDDLDEVLADPRMAYEIVPDESGAPNSAVRTACVPCPTCAPSDVPATPARRIVDTADRLGARGAKVLVQSICEPTFANAVERILSTLGTAIAPSCITAPVARNDDGLIACSVAETLPLGERCEDGAAAGLLPDPIRIDEQGREVCRVRQLSVSFDDGVPRIEPGDGFYFDDFSAEITRCGAAGRMVAFTPGAALRRDVETRLDCIVEMPPTEGRIDVGAPCEPQDPDACRLDDDAQATMIERYGIEARDSSLRPSLFACEPGTSTCQMTCASDRDCPTGTSCLDGDGRADSRFFPRCVFPGCR